MATEQTLAKFKPYANEPPSGYPFATLDFRNQRPILDFDKDTNESAVFSDVMPRNYSGNGITAYVHWSSEVVSGNVIWDVAFERIGDNQGNLDTDDFAAIQSVTDTVPAGDYVTIANIPFTDGAQIDSIAIGELYRLKITRDADNGSDTLDDDAELHAIELKET